ncbi:MAG TPA: TerD family protein [Allosphingosinicella sp.]|jgi:hypothetical protein|uniref:TerD family protein n=1 Tax=Allosphingosinicella sp. TaxID=2823234 RepID=UPI002F2AEE5D
MAEPHILARGANVALPHTEITASVEWNAPEKAGVYACLIGRDGNVRTAQDINPGYPRVAKGNGPIGASGPQRVSYEIDVRSMPADVAKIIFCVVAGDPARSRCGGLGVRLVISSDAKGVAAFELPADLHLEAAAILGELYRRNEDWKFRAVGQGFTEGLDPLAKFIGCTPHDLRTAYLPANGAAPAPTAKAKPAQSPAPPPPPPVPPAPAAKPAERPEPKPAPSPAKAPARKREPAAHKPHANLPGAEEASAFTVGRWVLTAAGVQPIAGVEVSRAELVQRELLDVRPDAAGLLWPAQFRHQPVTGEALATTTRFLPTVGRALGPAGLPELDEVTAIDPASRRDEQVPDGARLFASGGSPPRLVAIDPADGQAWWKAPWSDRWASFGRCPRAAALPAYASGAAGNAQGVFYAGESALVHLLADQQPTFTSLPVSASPLGAPALVGGHVLLPIGSDAALQVAIRLGDGSLGELPVAGAKGAEGPLGAPVVNGETGMCFWPGASGFLLFEEGLDGPSCAWRPWPAGVAGLPFQRPFRAANGRFWAMCVELTPGGHGRALACSMAAAGSRDRQTLLGPHASVGTQTFRGRARHLEPWRGADEEINLGLDYDGRWLLPLLRLGDRQTVLGLVDGAASAREFLFREEACAPREITLALHSDNGRLAMLGQSFDIASTDDLELFLDGERLCIHHHESNQCASWSVSFSR